METAGNGYFGNIGADPGQHLRQCIPERRAIPFTIALTLLFVVGVRVLDV
jgi:hypothetical protein